MKNYVKLISILLLLTACGESSEEDVTAILEPTFSVDPPIDSLSKGAESFTIDNTKDTVLITDFGSFIHIPENCFVNASGEIVKEADVAFKEYQNVADIFFSGIPMEVVEGSDTSIFQSAGMCEIDATFNGEELQLAANKKIDIGMRNKAKAGNYNLYFFDEEMGEWIEKEKAIAVDTTSIPKRPVDPSNLDTNRIVNVNIHNVENRERYGMWHGSKFYLMGDQEPQHADENIFWYHMNVEETTEENVFVLSFKGAKEGKQYREILIVQAVPKAGKYDEVLADFKEKMRLQTKIILANNEKIRKEKLQADQLAEQLEKEYDEQQYQDSLKFDKYQKEIEKTSEVTRTFSINQLGIYNCDRFYTRPILAEKQVNFTYDDSPVDLHYSALCHPRDNAVLRNVPRYGEQYEIKVASGQHFFIGVSGDKILCSQLDANNIKSQMPLKEISKTDLENLVE